MWCCSSLRVLRDDLGTMDDTSHGMGSRVRAERGLVGSAGVHNHVKSASCRGLCSHLFRLCHGCETISMFGHGQLAVFFAGRTLRLGSSGAAKQGPNKPCFAGKRRSKQEKGNVERGTTTALVANTPTPPHDEFTRAIGVCHGAYVIYGNDETTVQRTTNLLQPVASVNTSSSEKKPGSGIAQPLLAAHVLG